MEIQELPHAGAFTKMSSIVSNGTCQKRAMANLQVIKMISPQVNQLFAKST